MQACKTFQKKMEQLAKMAGIDLYSGPEAHMQVKVGGFEPLTIENIGNNCIAVKHHYIQNGDNMDDPEVVFFVGYKDLPAKYKGGWVPMTYQQDGLNVYQVVAKTDGDRITHLAKKGQADLARFVNQWARNLEMQGFFDPGLVQIVKAKDSMGRA